MYRLSLYLFLLLGSTLSVSGAVMKRAPRAFNSFSIAGGTAGNALAEAKAAFPGTAASLSAATTSDFNADSHCAVLAEQAFLDAGAVASSNRASSAVSAGLFKNKVLKIYGTLLVLQAEVAQAGGIASASQQAAIDDQTTKLAANVKVDQTNAGLKSESVSFTCPS